MEIGEDRRLTSREFGRKVCGAILVAVVGAVFFTMLLQSKRTARIAKNNQQVMEWAKTNFELMI